MQVDQLGCKAEMIAQYFFWSHKAKYKQHNLIDPIKDCDIIVGQKRIDVKGTYGVM